MTKLLYRAMQRRILLIEIITALFCRPMQAETELAVINKKVITLEEFNRKYQENLKYFPLGAPTKKAVLDDLIKRELGIYEAKKQALDQNPEIADRMNTVLFNALIDRQLASEIEHLSVSNDEAKARYLKSPTLRTSHILITLSPHADELEQKKSFEKIKKIQLELKKNKNFSKIAQLYSEGPAAPMGGDIDYQPAERLDPIYYATALQLKVPGSISDIVRTPFGYQIIQLTGIKPWNEIDPNQVKRLVLEEKKTEAFEKYISKLKKNAEINVHSELLKD